MRKNTFGGMHSKNGRFPLAGRPPNSMPDKQEITLVVKFTTRPAPIEPQKPRIFP
jgi:hypothetical protein